MKDRAMSDIALDEEAESLPIHVRMCAMRHNQIQKQIDTVREDISDLDSKITDGFKEVRTEVSADIEKMTRLLSGIRVGVWAAAGSLITLAGSIYGTFFTAVRHLAGS